MSRMRVGEICNRHAVIVGKLDSIYTAAVLMREHHANYLVVVESCGGNNVPVGSLTDRDIVVDIIAKNADLAKITISDVMNPHLLLAEENDSVISTLKRMRHKRICYIPIVNAKRALIGVLSLDAILDVITEQLNDIGYIINREPPILRETFLEKY